MDWNCCLVFPWNFWPKIRVCSFEIWGFWFGRALMSPKTLYTLNLRSFSGKIDVTEKNGFKGQRLIRVWFLVQVLAFCRGRSLGSGRDGRRGLWARQVDAARAQRARLGCAAQRLPGPRWRRNRARRSTGQYNPSLSIYFFSSFWIHEIPVLHTQMEIWLVRIFYFIFLFG